MQLRIGSTGFALTCQEEVFIVGLCSFLSETFDIDHGLPPGNILNATLFKCFLWEMNQHDGTFLCFVGDMQMFQLYQQYYVIIVWLFYACSRQLMAGG